MRIDVYLCDSGLCKSRTEAKKFIEAGAVSVSGKTVTKPSLDVDPATDEINIDKSSQKYVSRGGTKLEGALSAFGISPLGKVCIDVGASSGGFTDCLLQNGAASVVAVDSGSGQLAEAIRLDKRVKSIENYNARYMSPSDFECLFDLAVMDVSFISATYIIPSLYNCLACGADYILLIKPQFEVGRGGLSKGGIVKDEKLRRFAVQKVTDSAAAVGFKLVSVTESPIRGGDGNIEFLAHFKK